MPYYGGKSPRAQVGPWIAALLPHTWRQTYVEPFAGMLGVLLCRAPCECELANDLDGDVTNWWKQVRDNPDEMTRRMRLTPISRRIFEESLALLKCDGGSDLDRAVAFQCVVTQSVTQAVHRTHWSPRFLEEPTGSYWEVIRTLATRLSKVQLECRPAEEILDRVKDLERAVVYCDPPYLISATATYVNNGAYDQARTAELLLAQRGFAAVSGYVGDGWDDLLPGWARLDKGVKYRGIGKSEYKSRGGGNKLRVESLWVNKPPMGTRVLF